MKTAPVPLSAICPVCHAPYREWRLTELHFLDGTTKAYVDPVVSLLCDCGKPKAVQLSLLELPV